MSGSALRGFRPLTDSLMFRDADSPLMRPLRPIAWGLLLATIALAIVAYAQLPDRIPMHLGIDGRPGSFREKGLFSWFLLPGMALLLQLLLEGVTIALPSKPHLFNFPDKARFLALPAEYRAPVIREMQAMLDATAVGMQALMLSVIYTLWRAAMGARGGPGSAIITVGAVILSPLLLLWLLRVTAAVDREERRWREAGSPTP